ncbi:MAG: hypothetical protein MUC28_02395 [Planctomycetes bacterium]|jgi:hypothetical protein|nr:hypothetical protein [Planctomycetota bacterium]
MTKKILCEDKVCVSAKPVRVRIIKAPIVNTIELRRVVFARARALVL